MSKKTFGSVGIKPVEPRGIIKSHEENKKTTSETKKPIKKKSEKKIQVSLYFTPDEYKSLQDKKPEGVPIKDSPFIISWLKKSGVFE